MTAFGLRFISVAALLVACFAPQPARSGELRPPQPSSGKTAVELLKPDPNVRNNIVPLELDEFRYPDKVETGRPSVQILSISPELYPGKNCDGCIAVNMRLRNDSPSPVIMDGDAVKASFAGTTKTAISESDLLKLTGGQFSKKQIGTLAAVTAVSLALAEPVVQDMMTTSKRDLTKSYGVDEIRRKAELARFGKRVLLPDEELDAAVFFKTGDGPLDNISVPVLTYPDGKPNTCLTVEAPANLAPKVKPQQAQPVIRKE
ncbi:MAG: hypothetical protein K2W95_03955 [Candidatus Obscuribacterales bacterium]|nr:hypothetical protein [Candidatus Obscuribacterales bacterium]